MGSQALCSIRQADEALSCVPVVHEKSGTDSLRTLEETNADLAEKSNNPFCWSEQSRPNPLPECGEDSGGYIFTDKLLTLAPFAKVFATGPQDSLKTKTCFFKLLCRKNIFMKSREFLSSRGIIRVIATWESISVSVKDTLWECWRKRCPSVIRCEVGERGRTVYGAWRPRFVL